MPIFRRQPKDRESVSERETDSAEQQIVRSQMNEIQARLESVQQRARTKSLETRRDILERGRP